MKLIKIELGAYKVLRRGTLRFSGQQIFPKWSQILGLIGPNGSWKTTLCSLIAKTFQSIFTRSKLDFNIKIEFEISNSIKSIECEDECVRLFIDWKPYYDFKLGSKFGKLQREFHNWKLHSFWQWKIILSTFETNGEYPNEKPYNFKGADPLIKYDLAGLYGKQGYGYPSITNGIIRFLKNESKQNIANIFLEQMGFRLAGKIDLKIVSNIADFEPYLDHEDKEALSEDFITSRHYSLERVRKAERKKSEIALYQKIENDEKLKLTSMPQVMDFSDTLQICSDYSEYIWRYIFLNGLRLIKGNVELGFKNLSSGEKFLIMRYISILSWIERDSIVIVEEPENHLNPKWKELIVPALHKAASEYDSVLIFTTHDHKIIRHLHNNCVRKISQGATHEITVPTLLCDEFDFESLGERTIPFVYDDLQKIYRESSNEEKAEILNSMCNVEEKMHLRKAFLMES